MDPKLEYPVTLSTETEFSRANFNNMVDKLTVEEAQQLCKSLYYQLRWQNVAYQKLVGYNWGILTDEDLQK